MIHHIVMWNLKESLSPEEKRLAAEEIRKKLEAVKEQVEGVLSLKVIINSQPSSNKDVALVSCFTSVEALSAYQTHPAHLEASAYVKTVTEGRSCMDYEENKEADK